MVECDYVMEFFYEHMDNLKRKYHDLISDSLDDHLLAETQEDIERLEGEISDFKGYEDQSGIDREERQIFIMEVETDLYDLYAAIGKEGKLKGLLKEVDFEF